MEAIHFLMSIGSLLVDQFMMCHGELIVGGGF